MTDDQWNRLLYAIKKGRCLLMLGAGASTLTKEGVTRPLTEWLALELAAQLRQSNHPLVESESGSLLYVATEYFKHCESIVTLQEEVEKFYAANGAKPNELYRSLAKLPFPLVVSTTPDTLLEKAWDLEFKEWSTAYYSFQKDKSKEGEDLQIEAPNGEHPLLYNLFGDVKDPASLVLTEKDRLKFIEDIIQHNNAIPNAIIKEFKDKIVLFLGFDFEQWHLRIMPKKIFREEKINAQIFVPNGGYQLSQSAKVFFQNQYKMDFLPQDSVAFVKELLERWEESDSATTETLTQAPVRAVYLYAKEDKPWKEMLDKHLAVLRENQGIDTWEESMILGGENEDAQVQKQINQANLILLLVSSDFLASDKLYNEQLRQALTRNRENKAFVVPILVRSCVWEGAVFSKSKFILPKSKEFLANWPDHDAACRNIVIDLEKNLPKMIENLQA
jgi:SIR2-like domain/TIR domain